MNLPGFHKLSPEERLKKIKEFAKITDEESEMIKNSSLDMETASIMIENVIGTFPLPLGIATNFIINGKEKLIPMVLEEPSVIAAASYAAKLSQPEGFQASSDDPIMIGQIQLVNPKKKKCIEKIIENREKIIELCNKRDSILVKLGGGAKNVEAEEIDSETGKMIIVNIFVDVRDAMGANAVNAMCEITAPFLEEITDGKARLRIISNLATKRLARARAVWKKEVIGEEAVNGIIEAYHFAKNNIYRCATHNKGIMNGIDAVTIATGNDFRAVEAGAHAYASLDGYKPLTKYEKNKNGDLVGSIELPIAVGIIGGATRTHPIAKISLKLLDVKTAKELAEILAAVGLAQNFAALRALSTEGIQRGHMELHAKNIAVTAGAKGNKIGKIAEQMIKEKNINVSRAKELLSQ